MADDSTQRDIGRIEGRLDGIDDQLAAIHQLLKEQNVASSESRKALYERVGAIETDIKISAGIDAQVRERLDAFDVKLTDEVMPTINEVRRWKVAGVTVITMAGFAGASIAGVVVWAWDVIVQKWSGGP
ncbi:hypothetical protein [Pelagibacterium lacus]|uniref:DUF1515 domain-containing protein n=1 Tax=Pelagibacterium lacus TaxID=2282655 RepID=A0A369W3J3_9HYPH|nr:hypothetical protein [Pelagibacterium lacus]RDE08445.1 hypothetical protein DVH29_11280 [Pelagibacterium lacus]